MRRFLACLLVCFSASLYAQSTIDIQPQQCVWHEGDNAAWAAPELNDSAWTPLTKAQLPDAARLWVRCRVPLDRLRTVSKRVVGVDSASAYELFFQGLPAGKNGNIRSGRYSEDIVRIYPLPLSGVASGSGILALRITYRMREEHGEAPLSLEVGNETDVRGHRAQLILDSIGPLLEYMILYAIIGVIGAVALVLFWYDRSRRELLWLSLYCIFIATLRMNTLAGASLVDFPGRVYAWIYLLGNFCFIFQVLFFFAVAGKRIPSWLWIIYALSQPMNCMILLESVASPELTHRLAETYVWSRHIGLSFWTLLTLAPFVAFWPWKRISGRLRPIAVCCFLWSLSDFVYFLHQSVVLDWLQHTENYGQQAVVLYEARAFVSGATVLLILALLFRDQRRITEERAVLAGELQAAREIQRVLAPDELTCAPGLAINVAFRPMRDVGGDFYLCRVLADGRQRLLLGDVSGKGTAAAMTAALLLGGAEDHDELAPGELLSHLSRVLRESRVGGFATCLCADFDTSGNVTFANAGHLPPYRAGEELPTVSALPLGLAPSAAGWYEETTFALDPGDTLTFLSDGVVEARSSTGELFGFDRARAISHHSPEEIARTAQDFGQEDDITVLTLTFAPAEVLLA